MTPRNSGALTVVGIQSIAPRNMFFKPISWRLHLGAERFIRSSAKGDLVGTAGGGAGLGYELWDGAIVSGFVDSQISVSPHLPDTALVDMARGWGCSITRPRFGP